MDRNLINDLHEKFMEIYKRDIPPFLNLAKEIGVGVHTLRMFMDKSTNITRPVYYKIEKWVNKETHE